MQMFGQQPMQNFGQQQQPTNQKIRTLSSQIMSNIFPAEPEDREETNNSISPNFQFFPITSCEMVQCSDNMLCATKRNCDSCNPVCFPPDKITHESAVKITCENVKCPNSFRCLLDNADQTLKCVEEKFFQMKNKQNTASRIIDTSEDMIVPKQRITMTTPSMFEQRIHPDNPSRQRVQMSNQMVENNLSLDEDSTDMEKQALNKQMMMHKHQVEQQKRLEKQQQERQVMSLMEKEGRTTPTRETVDERRSEQVVVDSSRINLEQAINSLLEERKVDPKDRDRLIRIMLDEISGKQSSTVRTMTQEEMMQQNRMEMDQTTMETTMMQKPGMEMMQQQPIGSARQTMTDNSMMGMMQQQQQQQPIGSVRQTMTDNSMMGMMQQQQQQQPIGSARQTMTMTDKNIMIPEDASPKEKQA